MINDEFRLLISATMSKGVCCLQFLAAKISFTAAGLAGAYTAMTLAEDFEQHSSSNFQRFVCSSVGLLDISAKHAVKQHDARCMQRFKESI